MSRIRWATRFLLCKSNEYWLWIVVGPLALVVDRFRSTCIDWEPRIGFPPDIFSTNPVHLCNIMSHQAVAPQFTGAVGDKFAIAVLLRRCVSGIEEEIGQPYCPNLVFTVLCRKPEFAAKTALRRVDGTCRARR
jgi:hypothetical protein